jgi:membrane associated rhomboid family serine protease
MLGKENRSAIAFFGLGLLVGGAAGLIGGTVLFEDRPGLVVATAAAGGIIFGVLGLLFKERVVEFFPWY